MLYVDDSGSVGNPGEEFFVLGGVSVFERGIYHLIRDCDECVAEFGIGDGVDVELHGSEAYSGRGRVWGALRSRAEREEKIQLALDLLARPTPAVRLFAVAVNKEAVSPRDPIELAFEEICNRFNLFLQRNNNRKRTNERGLIVMDKSKHERPLQSLARHFRVNGATWGQFRNLAEVPLFVDSTSTRLVQLADLVAWATWRKFEHQDGRFFDKLIPRFDADGGVIHGLYHAKGNGALDCYCPACHSRATR
ncbi:MULTISPECIES: DUF3800 domain-containing protein [Hyphobacterium]|uniref:DUF3800 domain-containing protein n=1 Tax=Hyphobacterium vulgare TaxID=1736751 RepID=A0ABV6ZUR7_9PROT